MVEWWCLKETIVVVRCAIYIVSLDWSKKKVVRCWTAGMEE